jgi:glycosyltransferase involved in cell wall biosynthesis
MTNPDGPLFSGCPQAESRGLTVAQKLKVLHVVPYFPPDGIGGVGEVAAHLHRSLLAGGNESIVMTCGRTHDDPRVHRIARTPTGFILASGLNSGLLRDCDVVHCHHGEALALLMMNKLRRTSIPILTTIHCSCSGIGRSHRPYQINGRWFGRDLRARTQRLLISPSRHLMDRTALWLSDQPNFISRHGAEDFLGADRARDASVVYYGLPPLAIADDVECRAPIKPAELLFVGTPSHRKRINMLPYVLAAVRERCPDARLRIIGFDLEEQSELLRLCRDLGVLDAIDCVGCKLSTELAPYYAASKVLLVPSAHEGLPMVILEAQQHGLPCVATRVSGHPEVITDGENGFLVELDDPATMANRCVEIICEPSLQGRMRAAAQPVVPEKFSIEQQTRAYLELYEEVSAQRVCPSTDPIQSHALEASSMPPEGPRYGP